MNFSNKYVNDIILSFLKFEQPFKQELLKKTKNILYHTGMIYFYNSYYTRNDCYKMKYSNVTYSDVSRRYNVFLIYEKLN